MTRSVGLGGELHSCIIIFSGSEFRSKMERRSAEAEMWHLYNIMQHSTNSGAVTWQSAIHSLVVEAIRRDEAEGFHMHNMLGKALNGLLPRKSRLEDLEGKNGWADLAWLLELNQGSNHDFALVSVHASGSGPIEPAETCSKWTLAYTGESPRITDRTPCVSDNHRISK